MWYLSLLQYQAKKICKSNKEMAERFIAHLIYLVEQSDFEFELIAVLGFIKDLYLFGERNQHRNVSLSEFSRECMGLLILHMKYTDDYLVKVSDFIPFCKDKFIFATLDIQGLVEKLTGNFCKTILLKEKDHSLLSKNFKKNAVIISHKDVLNALVWIEKEVFSNLGYVFVDIDELILVFRKLIAEVDDPYQLVSELSVFLEVLENQNEEFDRFIFEIRKMDTEFLPLVLSEICLELEEYLRNTAKSCFSLFFFCYSTQRTHSQEVTEIIEKIKQKQLNDADSILEKLYEIEVIHPKDKLIDTIQHIEDKYRSFICQI